MNETNEQSQAQEPSYVLVKFTEVGSVLFTLQVENVNPLQILALASYLEIQAKSELVDAMNQQREARQQISRPNPGLIVPKPR